MKKQSMLRSPSTRKEGRKSRKQERSSRAGEERCVCLVRRESPTSPWCVCALAFGQEEKLQPRHGACILAPRRKFQYAVYTGMACTLSNIAV